MDTDTVKGDERLQKAVIEAEKTKKLTPIIKEELRYSILARRCKENKGDIELDEEKTIIKMVNKVHEFFFYKIFFSRSFYQTVAKDGQNLITTNAILSLISRKLNNLSHIFLQ